ncbi:tRNA (adenosine(37)-N6)-threonylcarbamoyltransferase complex ATPase subunit type 1 TsaE [Candidatus Daviesbacteria bacterium]|nr:tRNA (adenosine(37)-N6)-threonylcarbamoyltransferase complex ATPase subunit type 1 TsaE [Candidatus Daviesbacteria bacterium]
MIIKTSSATQTQEWAAKLAQKYRDGGILALSGPLGAGKTTFIQGFAQGLGLKQHLISPTFIIARQYPLPHQQQGMLFHLDLYRLENVHQMEELGLSEIFANPKNIILIEWAEKLGSLLPKNATLVNFKILSPDQREIEVKD